MEDKEVKKNRNKGFTLIELLAVIVILGVLMAVAIPSMTRYIENSKKDAFWQMARTYINSARYGMLNDSYNSSTVANSGCSLPDPGKAVVIPIGIIELEKGTDTSAWNKKLEDNYVVVENTGSVAKPKYVYYYAGLDTAKNGIPTFVSENGLKRGVVEKGTSKDLEDYNSRFSVQDTCKLD